VKVTAIIPTFNRASYLLEAIKSVEDQTQKVDEIIIIDDGSNDNTKELVSSLHVRYIYQENRGVSSARNLGIELANNDWIAFLDSDDTWKPNKIEIQTKFHKENPNLFASFSNEIWIRGDKEIPLKKHQQKEEPTFLNSLRNCKIGTSTFFANKTLLKQVGVFDEELKACEDYDLWLRILSQTKIGYIDKKLTTKYTRAQNQLSFTTAFMDIYRIKALLKHLNTVYADKICDEIAYKLAILKKGAIKHNNEQILHFCKQLTTKINLEKS